MFNSLKNKKTILVTNICALLSLLLLMSCKIAKIAPENYGVATSNKLAITQNESNKGLTINFSNSLLTDSNLLNAHIGICVYEPLTKKYLIDHQGDKYFVPCSNVKIATCYAAMKYLDDSIVGLKYLENDSIVYIQGTADPSFLHKDYKIQKIYNWLNTKKNKKIILCNNKFTENSLGKGWAWDDFKEPYMAERSAMPLYGNVVNFYYKNGYKTIPKFFEKFINNKIIPTDANAKFNISRSIGKNDFYINQGKKMITEITFSTNETPHIITALLTDTLHRNIENGSHITSQKLYSQPTDSLLKKMMQNSDNFIAEQVLLMISNKLLDQMNDEEIIDTLLKTDFKNLPQKPKWVDGCGLSRYNLFTTRDIVFMLNKMKTEFSWERITNIFPTANQGTLYGFYKKYVNKIFAKTGTLSNNTALSGFIVTNTGKQLLFSILLNNYLTSNQMARQAIENFVSNLIEGY